MQTDEQKNREQKETAANDGENKVEDLPHGSLEAEQSDEVKGGMIRQRFRPEQI